MSRCLTPWDFERYDSGELALADAQKVRVHLHECEDCRSAHARYRSDQTVEAPARGPGGPATPVAVDATQSMTPGTLRTGAAAAAAATGTDHFPRIPGYQITGVLGQGGMGVVYRAVQAKLSRTVALKVLPAMVGKASQAAVSRFRREATSAARLHHTNIIPVYDFGESPEGYFYAMELIAGQPLDVFIRRLSEQNAASASVVRLGRLLRSTAPEALGLSSADAETATNKGSDLSTSSTVSAATRGDSRPLHRLKYFQHVARWMADAASALNYAHEQGIIHRDIKPANLILSDDGRIMLADFGLAKGAETESVTMTGTLVGTLRYMSPEQSMAKRVRVDHRTDLYSLGATMYELLCFQPAFSGDDQKAVLGAIISRDPKPPRKIAPAVPAELETICLKCLEKTPDARYATGRAMAEDLLRFINDLPIVAKRPGPIRRTGKLIRRHKAATVAIAAIFLLCGAAGLGVHLHRLRVEAEAQALEAENESRLAQAASRLARAEELIADGVRWQESPTTTRAATRDKLLKAARLFEEALSIKPMHHRALTNLAIVKKDLYNNQEDPDPKLLEEANDYCDRALAVQQEDPTLWNIKGVILKKLGRLDEATDAYRRAAQIEPDRVHWWDNLGVVQALNRRLAPARASLERASELAGVQDPCNVHAWRDLAALQALRDEALGLESVDQALACKPLEPWSNVIRARLLLRPGGRYDPTQAMVDLNVAQRSLAEEPRLLRLLALAHWRRGSFARAVEYAGRAIQHGDMPTVNHLIMALAEWKRGNQAKAQVALREALATWPKELEQRGDISARAPGGILWFDTADELFDLRDEAQRLIQGQATVP